MADRWALAAGLNQSRPTVTMAAFSFGGDSLSIVLGPGEGKNLNVLGLKFTTKAAGGETEDAYTFNEVVMSAEAPAHIHETEEEAIYIVEGEADIQVGDRTVKGTPGSFALVPRGTVHNLISTGAEPAKVLLIFSPAGVQGLFEEVDGETDMDKVMAAMGRYNMKVAG